MKKFILLFLISISILSCSKNNDEFEQIEKTTLINFAFPDNLLDNYIIYIINEKNDTIKNNSGTLSIKNGTYTIYDESIPNKMTWENRKNCISKKTNINKNISFLSNLWTF